MLNVHNGLDRYEHSFYDSKSTGSASGQRALAMDIIKTPWYIEVEVRHPNKIYQGGPSHEREGHK